MKERWIVLAAGLTLTTVLAKPVADWDFSFKPFSGEYAIYAGQLGETMPPTRTDRKLSIMVSGDLARDMFDSMGPDMKDACGGEEGGRIRRKKNVSCTYLRDDGYTCHIGINLRTGDSIPGSIC